MKRIIATLVCTSLLIVNSVVSYSAENDDVFGLDTQLNKMCLYSDGNAGVRQVIEEGFADYLEDMIDRLMENPDYAKKKMGIKLGDDDYEREQLRYMFTLDLDKGLLFSALRTSKYSAQYAQAGCFSYLLYPDKVFDVPGMVYDWGGKFDIDGRLLLKCKPYHYNPTIVNDGVYDYLKKRDEIKDELISKGETKVLNVSLFGMGYLTLLYIQGEVDEYLVKLCDFGGKVVPKINLYKLYTVKEMMSSFDDPEVQESIYTQSLSENVLATKPVYEEEARSLQSDGLIQGNENGLDLLKPLTRIEATAILVRAMGIEEAQTASTSYFADIPSDNWGAKYANIAYDKGIAMGVGDDLFDPNDTITASQFATLILRSKGEDPDWQTAVDIFVERGLITSQQAQTMDLFTRGDMAKMIYEARQNNIL